ncbi:hypothetical protein K7X08_036570 [Anisodus acutangulus]|uniref:Uncharacterized protein n=1 Tax=Anisodus acutangulus TaxID=402998 RepID=A0A9Q1QUZ7_9SOLA|nr:hypothetical protein K7X08_036570 [Anisodus acutangulus]
MNWVPHFRTNKERSDNDVIEMEEMENFDNDCDDDDDDEVNGWTKLLLINFSVNPQAFFSRAILLYRNIQNLSSPDQASPSCCL